VQQGSNPSNFAKSTFMTRKQDILSSVCVIPINVTGCSFQRNVKVNLANNSFLFKCILLENYDLMALDAI